MKKWIKKIESVNSSKHQGNVNYLGAYLLFGRDKKIFLKIFKSRLTSTWYVIPLKELHMLKYKFSV